METIRHFINLFPSATFPLILASFGLPALQQKLHKLMRVQSGKVKILLSLLLSVALAGLPAVIGVLHENSQLLGAYTAMVFTVISFVYQFLLKESKVIQADLETTTVTSTVPTVVTTQSLPIQPEKTDSEAETFA